MRSIHSISRKLFVLYCVLSSKKLAGCNPITNSDMNDRIREFSSKDDRVNSTDIKTLQKEESGRYTNFSPVHNAVRFKDASDSALSSSSYSRGLLRHELAGYAHDYEESPPTYGYEYHTQGSALEHHGLNHHAPEYYGHGHGHGHGHEHHGSHHDISYHHKHYDHALAAKAFLWPIAGIALLGAAAALVSNPVLLQLGVMSGRRKRRDTEETFDPQADAELSWLKKDEEQVQKDTKVFKRLMRKNATKQLDGINVTYDGKSDDDEPKHRTPVKYSMKQEVLFRKLRVQPTVQSPVELAVDKPRRFSNSKVINENNLVPVPLILRDDV